MIKPKNAGILQDNCLRCHGDLVHELVGGVNGDGQRKSSACTATRASVTANTAGLGGADARRTRSRVTHHEEAAAGLVAGGAHRVGRWWWRAATAAGHRAADEHRRAQERGAARRSCAWSRWTRTHRPGDVGRQLAEAVRLLPAHGADDAHALRRPRRQRGAARREDRARPVAQAHVPRLRVLDRLPRPARPRLHARRPGGRPSGSPSRSRARACTATPRSCRSTASSAAATR